MALNIFKKYRRFFHGQCAVLLYHRVTKLTSDPQLLSVTPENFDAHLSHLSKNYYLLTVEEFCEILGKEEEFPPKSVLLTFDDGYADNFLEALPILEKYQTQAMFYICTGNLNTENEFWWDELERLILLPEQLPPSLSLFVDEGQRVFLTPSMELRKKAYDSLLPIIRSFSPMIRRQAMEQINSWAGKIPPRHTHRSMTTAELRKLAESPFAIVGAHTHSHQSLAALTEVEQRDEIKHSKTILEELTGKEIKHFSYPFGTKNDYDETTMDICDSLGIEWVAANFPDTVDKNSDHFQFPRFLVRNWNEKEFSKQVEQFFK